MLDLCAPFSNRIKMVSLVLTSQPALNTKYEKTGHCLTIGLISGSQMAISAPSLNTKNDETILEPFLASHYPTGANMGDARGHFPNGSNVTPPFSKRIKMAHEGTGYLDLPCAKTLTI